MINWAVVISVAATLTAVGTIIGFAKTYGGPLVAKLVRYGISKMNEEDINHNEYFKKVISNQGDIAESVKRLAEALELNTVMTLRLEIKDLIRNSPEQRRAIEAALGDYHAVHGDSYVDAMYDEWKEEYLKVQAKQELKKAKGGK